MLTLLKTILLPTLEYCCPLWSPTDQRNINTLEVILRSFTKKIDGLHNVPYWDRLRILKLFSLEH